MSNALPNPTADVFFLENSMIEEGREASRTSHRKRMILPVQRTQEAKVQRLLNFLQPGTYIRPHCHPLPHATESVCLLAGHLEVLIFDPDGQVIDRHHLTSAHPLIDIEPGTWHGMLVHESDTIIFEVKQGPYNPNTDKEFAPWAPTEDSPDVGDFVGSLRV